MESPATDAHVALTEVCVLADDLIWSSRLRAAIERAGARPLPVRSVEQIRAGLAVIDLGGRTYDGVAAVTTAVAAGTTVLAVGQHDDVALRQRALAAGARRVLAYSKLFNDGPGVIARLIGGGL